MNNTGTRRANGEGSIYKTIQKIRRSKKLEHECDICKNCTDRSLCNNRNGTSKCQKCIECTDCLKYCDRFYCYFRYQAQISIDKKHTTVANAAKKKAAVDKKLDVEAKVHTKNYVLKNGITIIEVCKKLNKNKFEAGKIGKNTKSKDKYHYRYIENWDDFQKPVQKITYQQINNFLNSIRHLSQRRNIKNSE